MRKRGCWCRMNKKQRKNNEDFVMTQYSVLSNEYVSALHGAQTVITINLAVSFGVLAILATIITDICCNQASCLLYIACSVCSFIGLFGAVSCIRTIHISRELIIRLEKKLETIEKDYCTYSIRKTTYYKPLHITLEAFWMFAFIFIIILSISLLYTANNCIQTVCLPINFLTIPIVFVILLSFVIIVVAISEKRYIKKNRDLLDKLYEKSE